MTVSIEATSRKYRGRKAATYEAVRKKQERWDLENKFVEKILVDINPRSVLDVPCGSGRYFDLYRRFSKIAKLERVAGVDCSDEMLSLARKKLRGEEVLTMAEGYQHFQASHEKKLVFLLEERDARDLKDYKKFDVAVCVRFLDLIDERAMRQVVTSLCGKADNVILTIRFGEKYVPKSNTAEHDERKFWRLVRDLGFARVQEYPIFKQGWRVCHIRRGK